MELISREMAIDHIRVLGGEDRERLMGILNNKVILPTIESRPKGEWIECGGGVTQCSVCNDFDIVKTVYKYCPNCGADMRGEE